MSKVKSNVKYVIGNPDGTYWGAEGPVSDINDARRYSTSAIASARANSPKFSMLGNVGVSILPVHPTTSWAVVQ